MVVVLPRGRRRPAAGRQLLRRDRGLAAGSSAATCSPRSSRRRSTARVPGRRPTSSGRTASRSAARSASSSSGAPQPGMTRGFWNDPERYLETYWSRLPRDRGSTATGRSSTPTATGTSAAAPTTRSRSPASASARPRSRPRRRPTRRSSRRPRSACRTRSRARRSSSSARSGAGETDDDDLRAAIGRRVVEDLGKTLRPEAVVVVPALPKTRSGKIMRRVVRAAYLGLDPGRPVGARRPVDDRGDPPGAAPDGGSLTAMIDVERREGHRLLGRPRRHGRRPRRRASAATTT